MKKSPKTWQVPFFAPGANGSPCWFTMHVLGKPGHKTVTVFLTFSPEGRTEGKGEGEVSHFNNYRRFLTYVDNNIQQGAVICLAISSNPPELEWLPKWLSENGWRRFEEWFLLPQGEGYAETQLYVLRGDYADASIFHNQCEETMRLALVEVYGLPETGLAFTTMPLLSPAILGIRFQLQALLGGTQFTLVWVEWTETEAKTLAFRAQPDPGKPLVRCELHWLPSIMEGVSIVHGHGHRFPFLEAQSEPEGLPESMQAAFTWARNTKDMHFIREWEDDSTTTLAFEQPFEGGLLVLIFKYPSPSSETET